MRKFILVIILAYITGCGSANLAEGNTENFSAIEYSCLPCGLDCDTILYKSPGTCSHCNMELVDKATIIHKRIQPEQLCSLDERKSLFLDVRTLAEFNGTAEQRFGAIKNAVNIPIQELRTRMNELEKYKDKQIIVYCSHSHRSPRASYMLTQAGFTNVTNMDGGMSAWKQRVVDTTCNKKLYHPQ